RVRVHAGCLQLSKLGVTRDSPPLPAGRGPRVRLHFGELGWRFYKPRTRATDSSTARSSPASSRPADRPSRCGSTTVVCSTSTLVSFPSTVIVGRKLAGRRRGDNDRAQAKE